MNYFNSIILTLITGLLLLSGCKTREDIAREKLVNDMNMQMVDSQKLNADYSMRLQSLEDRLSNVTGKVEEGQHETKTTLDNRIKSLEEKISLVENTQSTQSETLAKLEAQVKEQNSYIKDVLSGLKTITKKGGKASSGTSDPYGKAMAEYKSGRYESAKTQFLTLLNGKSLSSGQKARVLHNLGMVSYIGKDDEKALTYFTRLFTEFPKTGYNKNGLLVMAKTFVRLKKNEEAKQVLTELISRFPKAKQIEQARKMLSSL
ncbi:MAG: tetratricopeptide repeat protein [Bacteriovoracaceae bacterium]|nr:tetratricopeptide repeat protein [Bacteriovoracaceae bacterium]